jgi:hypothetical protein
MIFTVPLQQGTVLANVVYLWIANGVAGSPTASGITQPSSTFAVFRIDSTPPAGAEQMIVYDSTNSANWNSAGYSVGTATLAAAQQILLASLWSPTNQPQTIVPANPAVQSICRCYGTWNDISTLSVDGVPMTLTLVAIDNTDPTLIYDMSATPMKNRETGLLIASRVANLMLVAGQLENTNGDQFVDMVRTDYITGAPANTTLQYLLTCDEIGAPASLSIISLSTPVTFQPVLFKLDTSTIGLTGGGTFDLSKKAVA